VDFLFFVDNLLDDFEELIDAFVDDDLIDFDLELEGEQVEVLLVVELVEGLEDVAHVGAGLVLDLPIGHPVRRGHLLEGLEVLTDPHRHLLTDRLDARV